MGRLTDYMVGGALESGRGITRSARRGVRGFNGYAGPSGNGESRRYQNQADAQTGAMSRNAGALSGLGMQSARTGQGLIGSYNSTFLPVAQRMALQAELPEQPYIDQAVNDVGNQFGAARGAMARNLGRMGVNPNSGAWAGNEQDWALAEAAARSGAAGRSRLQLKRENFNRMGQVAGIGQGVLGAGAGLVGQGMGALSSAAGIYDRAAGNYGAEAEGLATDERLQQAEAKLKQKKIAELSPAVSSILDFMGGMANGWASGAMNPSGWAGGGGYGSDRAASRSYGLPTA